MLMMMNGMFGTVNLLEKKKKKVSEIVFSYIWRRRDAIKVIARKNILE